LTCTFANFGKQRVRIQPDTRIAKLMFLSLDTKAKSPSGPWATRDYDSSLATMASESPATFLQLSDQSRRLNEIIASGTSDIKKASDVAILTANASVAAELTSAKAEFQKSVTADSRNAVFKAAPYAFVAVGLLAVGQWIATKFLTTDVEAIGKQRADAIEDRINKQLEAAGTKPVFVYSGSEESKALLERIKILEMEIKELQAKQK
jgi:hypothetical protein